MLTDLPLSIFLFCVFGGMLLLQVFLSKKKDKRIGLILPLIMFIVSLIPAISNTVILLNLTPRIERHFDWLGIFKAYASAFLLLNIPTIALIAVYAVCRRKYYGQRAIDKMSIQDLR